MQYIFFKIQKMHVRDERTGKPDKLFGYARIHFCNRGTGGLSRDSGVGAQQILGQFRDPENLEKSDFFSGASGRHASRRVTPLSGAH